MNFAELPQEWQVKLTEDRKKLSAKNRSDSYSVTFYNAEGTRYFIARRCQRSWRDGKGHSLPFGGGSYWTIIYGAVQFRSYRNCMGGREYELCEGKRYTKSQNGTIIPDEVETKKEVLEILNRIGIFN